MQVISTISYDENGNGYSLLFTMPVSRTMYVVEKYLLLVVLCCVSLLPSLLVVWIGALTNRADFNMTLALGAIPATMLMQFVEIPVRLWLGWEKSRMFLTCFSGIVCIIGILFLPGEKFADDYVPEIGAAEFLLVYGITLLVGFLSLRVSVFFMKRKEF